MTPYRLKLPLVVLIYLLASCEPRVSEVRFESAYGFIQIDYSLDEPLNHLEKAATIVRNSPVASVISSHKFAPLANALLTRIDQARLSLRTAFKTPLGRVSRAPLEFLGDLQSWLIGTPSASQFRDALSIMSSLQKQANLTASALNGVWTTEQFIRTSIQHVDHKFDNLRTGLETLNTASQNTRGKLKTMGHEMLAIAHLSTLVDAVITEAYHVENVLFSALSAGKQNQLSPRMFSPIKLQALLKQRTPPEGLFIPYISQPSFFFDNSLTHLLSNNSLVSATLRIPYVGNTTYSVSSDLHENEYNHPMRFRSFLNSSSGFRYLTEKDLLTCSESPDDTTLICPKRRIAIDHSLRGRLFVHDITATQLFITHDSMLPFVVNIVCLDTFTKITLPTIANLTLHPDCQLQSSTLRVWSLQHLPNPLSGTMSPFQINAGQDFSLTGLLNTASSQLHNLTKSVTNLHTVLFDQSESESDLDQIAIGASRTAILSRTIASIGTMNGQQLFQLTTNLASSTWMIWVPFLVLFLVLGTAFYFYLQCKFQNSTLPLFFRSCCCRRRTTTHLAEDPHAPSAPPPAYRERAFNHSQIRHQRNRHVSDSLPPPFEAQLPALRSSMSARTGILSKSEFDTYRAKVDSEIFEIKELTKKIPTLITRTRNLR